MSNYALVSAKQILARVIRAVGYKLPSTYHDDILEWIAEGIGLLQVTNSLILVESGNKNCPGEILVKNHCAPLPCGFVWLSGIFDENGSKLSPGNDVTNALIRKNQLSDARATIFNVNPFAHQTQTGLPVDDVGTSIPWDGSDLEPENNLSTDHFYIIQGNMIQTSFSEGYIKVRYYSLPVCSEGYPLIPDNENFKQALEWHIIRRLIASGYEHKVFTYLQADELFERSAGRAMGEISFPTPVKMAATNRMLVRLIPPDRFLEDFFING